MSEYMPEDMSDRMPEDMSEFMPEDMPDRMPEDMSDRVPEDMPEDMPDHMPEDMPDRMSNRMSEDMSDRMPEDLPVRKCINVMVGITRSKVIWKTIVSRFCPPQCIFSTGPYCGSSQSFWKVTTSEYPLARPPSVTGSTLDQSLWMVTVFTGKSSPETIDSIDHCPINFL